MEATPEINKTVYSLSASLTNMEATPEINKTVCSLSASLTNMEATPDSPKLIFFYPINSKMDFKNIPKPILWIIMDFAGFKWAAPVCKLFHGCFRENMVIKKSGLRLSVVLPYYQISNNLLVECCEQGLYEYVRSRTSGSGPECARSSHGSSPEIANRMITGAIQSGHRGLVAHLLHVFADLINLNFSSRRQLVITATIAGHIHIVELLLRLPEMNCSVVIDACIVHASENNQPGVLRYLLSRPVISGTHRGIPTGTLFNVALLGASTKKYKKIVELLLTDHRTDLQERGIFILQEACANGWLRITKMLVETHRIQPDLYQNMALIAACKHGHTKIVKYLSRLPRVRATGLGMARDQAGYFGFKHIMALLDRIDLNIDNDRIDPD